MTTRALVIAATLVAAVSPASAQTTITITADKDTTLYESATGALANGAGTRMFVGVTGQPSIRRCLVHFDVAGAIPAGARILSARLELNVQNSPGGGPAVANVHRVTQDWAEGPTFAPAGQGVGGPVLNGDTTWLHTNYPTQLWTNVGGDFVTAPSFSFTLAPAGSVTTSPFPGLIADVQTWLDNPSGNFGWVLKSDESLISTATVISAHETSNTSEQPRLIVNYLDAPIGSWGTGCPATTGVINLTPTGSTVGGSTIALDYSNAPPNSLGATFFSLELVPVGVEVFPSCSVYLPLAGVIIAGDAFVTSPSGVASPSLTVPAGFPGYLIVAQGAVLDSTPVGFALSNAGLLITQ